MKNKLILLLSIFSSEKSPATRNSRGTESLIKVIEEVGAWLLLGGFVLGIFWIAGILFSGQMS